MNPGFILAIGLIGATLGVLGYTYHQGRQSCISHYEALSLTNELESQKKEIDNYKASINYNEKLAGEAQDYINKMETKNAKLQAIVDSISDKHICVDDNFLRELRELRRARR